VKQSKKYFKNYKRKLHKLHCVYSHFNQIIIAKSFLKRQNKNSRIFYFWLLVISDERSILSAEECAPNDIVRQI